MGPSLNPSKSAASRANLMPRDCTVEQRWLGVQSRSAFRKPIFKHDGQAILQNVHN